MTGHLTSLKGNDQLLQCLRNFCEMNMYFQRTTLVNIFTCRYRFYYIFCMTRSKEHIISSETVRNIWTPCSHHCQTQTSNNIYWVFFFFVCLFVVKWRFWYAKNGPSGYLLPILSLVSTQNFISLRAPPPLPPLQLLTFHFPFSAASYVNTSVISGMKQHGEDKLNESNLAARVICAVKQWKKTTNVFKTQGHAVGQSHWTVSSVVSSLIFHSIPGHRNKCFSLVNK